MRRLCMRHIHVALLGEAHRAMLPSTLLRIIKKWLGRELRQTLQRHAFAPRCSTRNVLCFIFQWLDGWPVDDAKWAADNDDGMVCISAVSMVLVNREFCRSRGVIDASKGPR